jgi:hypothetical protein
MSRILKDLFVVLAAIFIGVVATIFLVFPRVANDLATALGSMGDPLNTTTAIIHGAVALAIWAALLFLIILPALGDVRRPRDARGLSVRKGQGVAYIDTESVRQQVFSAVTRVPNVQHTEVSINNRDGRADILLNIQTDASINAGKKKAEIRREIMKVVEDQLGVRVAMEPTINLSLERSGTEIPYAEPALDKSGKTNKNDRAESSRPVIAATPARDPLPPATGVSSYTRPTPEPIRPRPEEPISRPSLESETPSTSSSPVFTRRTFTPTTPVTERKIEASSDVTTTDTSEISDTTDINTDSSDEKSESLG